MPCKAEPHCGCEKSESVSPRILRRFCPHWYEAEKKRDVTDDWQYANFRQLDKDIRERCVAVLLLQVPKDVRAEWTDQATRGISIGCTDGRFHLGVGMAVRNALRKVILDDKLPFPHGWDDAYRGAIFELIAVHPVWP